MKAVWIQSEKSRVCGIELIWSIDASREPTTSTRCTAQLVNDLPCCGSHRDRLADGSSTDARSLRTTRARTRAAI